MLRDLFKNRQSKEPPNPQPQQFRQKKTWIILKTIYRTIKIQEHLLLAEKPQGEIFGKNYEIKKHFVIITYTTMCTFDVHSMKRHV